MINGACAHYAMVCKIQWKPFWLATQLYPQNDWTGWQNGVNDAVFARASLVLFNFALPYSSAENSDTCSSEGTGGGGGGGGTSFVNSFPATGMVLKLKVYVSMEETQPKPHVCGLGAQVTGTAASA